MSDRVARTAGARVHRRGGSSPTSRVVQLGGIALAFIGISVLVVTSSRAAFVAQNDNTGNSVSSAAIDLADNDGTTAMFQNVSGLVPGATQQRCIDVTYTGTVADALPVRLFTAGAPSGTLAPYLDVVVQVGSDPTPSFGDCTGFVSSGTLWTGTLADLATTHGTYATGLTGWDPGAGPETRTFRFALTVRDDAAAEGLTTTFGFTWETRTS